LVPLGEASLMRAIELNGVKPDLNKAAFTWGRLIVHDRAAVEKAAALPVSNVQTLDEMIERRASFLTEYQNEKWANQYRTVIADVEAAETRLNGTAGDLTRAAAKGLFKLMSYKDEYEVARLHTQTGFYEGLKDRFEGDFTVKHHLAPPLLPSGKDARGRPFKRAFGPWIKPAFGGLAKLKGLRGTAFDPFGYTAERKMERDLITEYCALLTRITAKLTADNISEATRIASLVMEIRGFGPVKEEAVHKVRLEIAAGEEALGL